ncbi:MULTISPECIES: sodium:solute symporter family protein [Aminobacterium]|uniref:sodium:solute symporter family protein n=1 Tax=Aminobacterium TaxID=81466 RepID=UPI00257FFED0|nr:sodium:solute symporter family protein [Aminobacterium sp. UBA4987]MDD4265010.1 sodium:solute symporter family protein [Aminobacterium colombiense]MDD4585427.1 sodium:solute symporter family protein [Aminobacterium colombiense]
MKLFTASALLVLFVFLGLGTIVARKIKEASDYTVAGRKAGVSGVAGVIMGALIGGASTVGTAQMAYEYGLSAWWFTLGGGIGCLILGWGFASPLRSSGVVTIPEFLKRHYGRSVSMLSMVASSVGTYISVVAQFLSGVALLQTVFPFPSFVASIGVACLILGFLCLGGLKSYSVIGKAKIAMLFLILTVSVLLGMGKGVTPSWLYHNIGNKTLFSPFGFGVGKGLGAFLSMIVGIFCTQIYIQGVFAASNPDTARKGTLLAGILIPPLGLMGIYIGLFMRTAGVSIVPSQALPMFIRLYFPPILGGIFWAGILITVVGAAAGLSFGIATNLVQDFLKALPYMKMDEKRALFMSRAAVIFIVLSAAYMGELFSGDMILQWSYLSMSLRGAGTFFPFIVALLFPLQLSPCWALCSAGGGLLAVLIAPFIFTNVPPLFLGLLVSASFSGLGICLRR